MKEYSTYFKNLHFVQKNVRNIDSCEISFSYIFNGPAEYIRLHSFSKNEQLYVQKINIKTEKVIKLKQRKLLNNFICSFTLSSLLSTWHLNFNVDENVFLEQRVLNKDLFLFNNWDIWLYQDKLYCLISNLLRKIKMLIKQIVLKYVFKHFSIRYKKKIMRT